MSLILFIMSIVFAITFIFCGETIIWLTNSEARTELLPRINSLNTISKIAMICMLSCALASVLFSNHDVVDKWMNNSYILFLVNTIVFLVVIFSILFMIIIRAIKKETYSYEKTGIKSLMIISFIGVIIAGVFTWLLS